MYAKQTFLIEQSNGDAYYGLITPSSKKDTNLIISGIVINEVPHKVIVSIKPLKSHVIDRFSGRLSAGFSYTKASEVMQLNSDGGLEYRWTNKYIL